MGQAGWRGSILHRPPAEVTLPAALPLLPSAINQASSAVTRRATAPSRGDAAAADLLITACCRLRGVARRKYVDAARWLRPESAQRSPRNERGACCQFSARGARGRRRAGAPGGAGRRQAASAGGKADRSHAGAPPEFYGGAADKVMGETIPFAAVATPRRLSCRCRTARDRAHRALELPDDHRRSGRRAALAMVMLRCSKPAEEACLTAPASPSWPTRSLPAGAVNGCRAWARRPARPGARRRGAPVPSPVMAVGSAASPRRGTSRQLKLAVRARLVFADRPGMPPRPSVNAGIQNAGQTCSAASRLLVERSRFDEVVERLAARYAALRVGPASTPLRRPADLFAAAEGDRRGLPRRGARAACASPARPRCRSVSAGFAPLRSADAAGAGGGHAPSGAGGDFRPGVQVVIPFDDEAQALAIANGTTWPAAGV